MKLQDSIQILYVHASTWTPRTFLIPNTSDAWLVTSPQTALRPHGSGMGPQSGIFGSEFSLVEKVIQMSNKNILYREKITRRACSTHVKTCAFNCLSFSEWRLEAMRGRMCWIRLPDPGGKFCLHTPYSVGREETSDVKDWSRRINPCQQSPEEDFLFSVDSDKCILFFVIKTEIEKEIMNSQTRSFYLQIIICSGYLFLVRWRTVKWKEVTLWSVLSLSCFYKVELGEG